MAQAQADGATVPIYYESRQVPVDVDRDATRAASQEVLETEEDEAQTEAVTRVRAAGRDHRRARPPGPVADDLAAHFTDRCQTLPGKAMVVAY